jgi:hypothetical protein
MQIEADKMLQVLLLLWYSICNYCCIAITVVFMQRPYAFLKSMQMYECKLKSWAFYLWHVWHKTRLGKKNGQDNAHNFYKRKVTSHALQLWRYVYIVSTSARPLPWSARFCVPPPRKLTRLNMCAGLGQILAFMQNRGTNVLLCLGVDVFYRKLWQGGKHGILPRQLKHDIETPTSGV